MTVADSLRPRLSKIADYLRGNSRSLKQSYIALFLSVVTGIIAGIFLGKAEELLTMLPGLVVLVPAALGMRGNIFASLGSRLSSALHMGSITRFDSRSPAIKNNIYASMALTIIFSIFLGVLAKSILFAFGFKSISLVDLILISFIGGILSGVIMLATTLAITFASYKKGWDPDNVTSPLITAFGDLFTVPSLMVGAMIVMQGTFSSNISVLVVSAGLALLVLLDIFSVETKEQSAAMKEASYRQIVIQSTFILVFTLVLDSLSGVLIQFNVATFVALPVLLVILPAFLEEGGNVGNIMAARLSTKLHLGSVEARLSFTKDIKLEFLNSYILSVLIFLSVGLLSYVFASAVGLGGLGIAQLVGLTLFAGLILTTVVVFLTFLVSVLAYRLSLDPDNVTIPIITSVADVAGVFCLIFVLHMLGIA